MNLRLDILPPAQRALWSRFGMVPRHFVLYGGTALALRLGHRQSLDFDFFSSQPFVPERLQSVLPFVADILQKEENTLSIRTTDAVKVSFFGGLSFGRIKDAEEADGVRIASLDDLFATKLNTIYQRCEAKDYLDVDALLQSGLTLEYGLSCARAVYGDTFNPMLPLKALGYFEDGNLASLPGALRQRLTKTVASVQSIPEVRRMAESISCE